MRLGYVMRFEEKIASTFRRYNFQNWGGLMSLLRRETGRNCTLAMFQGFEAECDGDGGGGRMQ